MNGFAEFWLTVIGKPVETTHSVTSHNHVCVPGPSLELCPTLHWLCIYLLLLKQLHRFG